MIDQAKRTAKDAAASAQSTIDNATGNNYRKRAQEANQAAENMALKKMIGIIFMVIVKATTIRLKSKEIVQRL